MDVEGSWSNPKDEDGGREHVLVGACIVVVHIRCEHKFCRCNITHESILYHVSMFAGLCNSTEAIHAVPLIVQQFRRGNTKA